MKDELRPDWTNQARSTEVFQEDDEIDLIELFAALWSKAVLIVMISIAGFALAVSYTGFMTTPVYEAKSTLVLKDTSSGPNLGQLGGIASLAGISVGGRGSVSSAQLEDRVMARDFILDLADTAGFENDPFFNPSLRPAGFVGGLLAKLMGRATEPATQAKIEDGIVGAFRKAISVNVARNGVIEVATKHKDSARAAAVTNAIIEKALAELLAEKKDQSHAQIEYLASELYRVQGDLDAATKAVEDFSVESRLVSPEELALVSSQLGDLRQRRERILGYEAALAVIGEMSAPGEVVNREALNTLLDQNPNANDLEFRRLLGWSGNATNWVWPDATQIEKVQIDVTQWRNDIDRQISGSEALVRNNATAAGQLAKLQREVLVQGAIYAAMLQQFETQSVAGGFSGDIGQVFEVAVPPVKPAAPQKARIAVLGLILGYVVGSGFALILSRRRGTLYTHRAISEAVGLRPWGTKLGRVLTPRAKDAQALLGRVTRRRVHELDEIAVDLALHDAIEIAVVPTIRSNVPRGVGLYLASSLAKSGKRIVLIDLTKSIPTTSLPMMDVEAAALNGFELGEGMTLIQPKSADGLSAMLLQAALGPLRDTTDIILVLCPTLPAGAGMVSAALIKADAAILMVKPGSSTRNTAEHANAILSRRPETRQYLVIE